MHFSPMPKYYCFSNETSERMVKCVMRVRCLRGFEHLNKAEKYTISVALFMLQCIKAYLNENMRN